MIFVTEPNTPAELFVSVFQRGNSLPAHLYVQISASYQSATGQNKNRNDWLDFSVNGSILNPSSAAFFGVVFSVTGSILGPFLMLCHYFDYL